VRDHAEELVLNAGVLFEDTAAFDLGLMGARVREREPDQVDEELHFAQGLARGHLAVRRGIGGEVAQHLAVVVRQHQSKRVAFVPGPGGTP